MFLRQEKRKGRIYLSIVETYIEPNTKKHKTRYIQTLGYLDELEKDYADPIAHFKQVAKEMTDAKKSEKDPLTIQVDPSAQLAIGENVLKNFGYLAISAIYRELGIDRFFAGRQRFIPSQYNLNSVFRLLIYGRAIYPGSMKETYENKHIFFDKSDFSLDYIYRSLDMFNHFSQELQGWLFDKVHKLYGRDTTITYYNVTNYYFDIDENGEEMPDESGIVTETGFSNNGYSKERRTPIVQMGLLTDSNAVPISYELFDGNIDDTLTLSPALKKDCMNYGLGKVIVVADKGLKSGDIIYYLLSSGNGYVLSKSVRVGSEKLKKYVLDDSDYEPCGNGFKIKSKPIIRKIDVTGDSGEKFKHSVKERLVVFYSEKYAFRAKKARETAIAKASDIVSHPSKYTRATTYGAAKYVLGISFVEDTGEIAEGCKLELNQKLIDEEASLDGYYAILSSEVEKSAKEILDIYQGLWHIEKNFKITNGSLNARSVNVERKSRIQAHFLTCFVTLLICRILQKKTNWQYSVDAILESLRKSNCFSCGQNYYQLTYYDEILQEIGKATSLNFNKKYRTLGEIKRIFNLNFS